jgi:hypothetical protein
MAATSGATAAPYTPLLLVVSVVMCPQTGGAPWVLIRAPLSVPSAAVAAGLSHCHGDMRPLNLHTGLPQVLSYLQRFKVLSTGASSSARAKGAPGHAGGSSDDGSSGGSDAEVSCTIGIESGVSVCRRCLIFLMPSCHAAHECCPAFLAPPALPACGCAVVQDAADWQAPCEVCGRTYPHEHIRSIYSSHQPGSDEDEDE